MTTLRSAALLFLLVPALQAWAGEPVDASLPAGADVSIDVRRGSVTVVGWDEPRVEVEGTRDDRSEAFVFEQSGDSIVVEDRIPDDARGGDGTRITVRLPRANELRVSLVSADLYVEGVHGRARLQSVSGDIDGRDLGGDVVARTVSGDVGVEHTGDSLRLDTVSGDLEVRSRARSIDMESVSGDVDLANAAPLQHGRVSTVSGDLEVKTAVDADVDLALESVSGGVTLALQGDVDARVAVDAGPGGDIVNRLGGVESQRTASGPMKSLEIRLGQGRGDVEVSTLSGRIELRASD